MSLFDKVKAGVKAGVTEAGNKAKTVVEINRLKLQNNTKLNEIDNQYREIGKLVYISSIENTPKYPLNEQLEPYLATIKQLQSEIQQNLVEIKFLSDEKDCPACGNTVSLDTHFCPKCGQGITTTTIEYAPASEPTIVNIRRGREEV